MDPSFPEFSSPTIHSPFFDRLPRFAQASSSADYSSLSASDGALAKFEDALRERGYKNNSILSYKKILASLIKAFPYLNSRKANPDRIVEASIRYMTENELSASYQYSLINVVRLYFRYVLEYEISDEEFKLPIRDETVPIVLESEAIEYMIKLAIQNSSQHNPEWLRRLVLTLLFYGTGLRTGEVRLLLRKHVDLERCCISVPNRKGQVQRIVPLSPKIQEHLQSYFAKVNPRKFVIEGREEGVPMTERSIQANISRLAQLADIEIRVTPGILRNSFATHFLQKGAPLEYVSYLLGHKSLSATRKYLQLVPMYKPSSPIDDLSF